MRIKKLLCMAVALIISVCCTFAGAISFVSAETDIDFISISDTEIITDGKKEAVINTVENGNSILDSMEWFGFEVKASESGTVCIGLLESNGAMYWPKNSMHKAYLVSEDGSVAESETSSQGEILIPYAFEGYVLMNIKDTFILHPGYATDETNSVLNLSDITRIQVWNCTGNAWNFKNFSMAKSKEAFIEAVISVENTNTIILNDNEFITDGTKTIEVANNFGTSPILKSAKWFGFYIKTDSEGIICVGLKETVEGGNGMYWLKNSPRNSYLVALDGTVKTTEWNKQGELKISEAFEGYALMELAADFEAHPGYADENSVLNTEEIMHTEIWNCSGTEWKLSDFAFSVSMEEFIKFFGLEQNTEKEKIVVFNEQGKQNMGSGTHSIQNQLPESIVLDEYGYLFFHIETATNDTDDGLYIGLGDADNDLYWTGDCSGSVVTVTDSAKQSEITFTKRIKLPANFSGFVAMKISDCFKAHPGYTEGNGKLEFEKFSYLQIWDAIDGEEISVKNAGFCDSIEELKNYFGIKAAAIPTVVNVQSFPDLKQVNFRNGVTIALADALQGKKGLSFKPSALSTVTIDFDIKDSDQLANKKYLCFYMKAPDITDMNMLLGIYDSSAAEKQMFWNNATEGYNSTITLIDKNGKATNIAAARKLNLSAGFEGYVVIPMFSALSLHPGWAADNSALDTTGITGMDIWFEADYAYTDKEYIIADICLADSIGEYAEYLNFSQDIIDDIKQNEDNGIIPSTGETSSAEAAFLLLTVSLAAAFVSGIVLQKYTRKA